MTPVPDTQTTEGPMTGEEHHRLAYLTVVKIGVLLERQGVA